MNIIQYIKDNKAWIFSGLGIAISNSLTNYFKNNDQQILTSIFIVFTILLSFLFVAELFLFMKRREFYSYLKSKIIELFQLAAGKSNIAVPAINKFNCFEHYDNYIKVITLIKKIFCLNQGMIMNYHYNGSRLHKKIRKLFSEDDCSKPLLIEEYKQELSGYLVDKLIDATKINIKYIHEYFNGRSSQPPRIVIKAYENGKIVDIYRQTNDYFTEYALDRNSGFKHVYDYGKYFFCNDIPTMASKDKYINPRLNNQKVRDYFSSIAAVEVINLENIWVDCWAQNRSAADQPPTSPSRESCYKSTMIIPMTLLNNEGLSDEFKTKFEIPRYSEAGEPGRAIYAFLCFDHPEINYFHEDIDSQIGYIFADILSLYFIERLNYTKFSDTLQTIDSRCNQNQAVNLRR